MQQAGAWQETDGTIRHQGQFQAPPSNANATPGLNQQWRERSDQPAQDSNSFLRSAGQRYQDASPRLNHPAPQQSPTRDWNDRRFSDVAVPDTELPQGQFGNGAPTQGYEIPSPRTHQQTTPNAARSSAPEQFSQSIENQPPALEDYSNDPFNSPVDTGQNASTPSAQSVLVDSNQLNHSHPLRNEQSTMASDSDNHLRDLRVEPRRLQNGHGLIRRNTYQSRYQTQTPYYQEDENGLRTEDEGRGLKSCEDFRAELLDNPITDIVLDISPKRPTVASQTTPEELHRTWTDCDGHILGTGTLTGLETSYIVITNESGMPERIAMTRLSDSDLGIVTKFWALPNECSLGCFPFEGRHWTPNSFFWKASALCHKPLYFENRQLERYGHTHGPIVQPFHSTAHFFTNLILWPYNSGINPPNECLYALGFYRPGDCAPWLKDPFPISPRGALRQGINLGVSIPILP